MGLSEGVKHLISNKNKVILTITEVGVDRIEKQLGTGYELRILQKLQDNGSMSLGEIATATGYDLEKVKAITWELKEKNCVTRAH